MTRVLVLILGAMATVIFALIVLVILPQSMLGKLKTPPQLKPYTLQEARGREVYIANGCIYCHSQQVRDPNITTDIAKGLGNRASVPEDYVHDNPHLLGTMRTGPDLFNVGSRLPAKEWHLAHLYQPRALVSWSIMPAFPFLFRYKPVAEPGDTVVHLPPGVAPERGVIVTTEDADALVAYLLALKHDYPAPEAGQGETAANESATQDNAQENAK
ncbi:MAG TPA: cbb3-type cytochrome c oxidase subunit II [Methylovorus sp.]|jgi:cytochrome c oxidase cbb3-type subunit II|nr:cbb3-type cytochrome c oxidase subunit II [Methylovorus sp.]